MTDHKELIEELRSGTKSVEPCTVGGCEHDARCLEAADALESAQEQVVEVKPLEWEYSESFGAWRAYAYTIGFEFIVHYNCDDRFGLIGWKWAKTGGECGVEPTMEKAKAAAQADYERRILSAITTRPASEVYAEATAAAYGAAADLMERRGALGNLSTGEANRTAIAVRALTPQSARDWLAQHNREIVERERERCAKIAEREVYGKQAAAAIRAGGEQ